MQQIIVVDAFTDRPFTGNPAAVCVMEREADAHWMQQVAAEMNLSETAFVVPRPARNSTDEFDLRWFTPTTEVDLCGHATLAAAHVLWETACSRRACSSDERGTASKLAGYTNVPDEIRFHTRSGELGAKRDGEWIELDFPATPAVATQAPAGLIESLGDRVRNRVRAIAKSRFDFLVELDIEQAELASLNPDLPLLGRIETRGIILTTSRTSDARFDFTSRFFAPSCGINEDPVTGSAHCSLGPWWGDRLKKSDLLAFQASLRGGVVRVKVHGDRVLLGGQAISVMRGNLLARL